jgi:hypothetical protein
MDATAIPAWHVEAIVSRAGVVSLQNRLDKAEKLFRRAVSLYTTQLGPTYQLTMSVESVLAFLFTHQGHPDQAEEMMMLVLEKQRRLLGETSQETLASVVRLAGI